MCETRREGIPFDAVGLKDVILGKTVDTKYSRFLGINDYKSVTAGRDQWTNERKNKDYNSFGNTKKFEF